MSAFGRRFILDRATPASPTSTIPSSTIDGGSGTFGVLTSEPNGAGTFWNRTKIALAIWVSVNPVNAAPETVNEALSPGNRPSLTDPPLKVPVGPVVKPKSSTTLLKPAGTLPRSASE